MIVDAHQHFWAPARGDYGWMAAPGLEALRRTFGPADLLPHLKAHGVERTVLVQAAPTLAETNYLLGIADATDLVGKIVGWIDFENPEDRRALTRFSAHPKFAGVRPMIQDIADPDWMLGANLRWALDALRDLDLTFDALGFPHHAPRFLRLFARYPDLRVVLDHGMKPQIRANRFDDWAADMRRLARETQTLCKLSGLATEAAPGWEDAALSPYVQVILEEFGADRVMFGSDWPVLNLNGDYGRWMAAARRLVPAGDQAAVFGGTAARFYRL
jgi:L-fuconolactonase